MVTMMFVLMGHAFHLGWQRILSRLGRCTAWWRKMRHTVARHIQHNARVILSGENQYDL